MIQVNKIKFFYRIFFLTSFFPSSQLFPKVPQKNKSVRFQRQKKIPRTWIEPSSTYKPRKGLPEKPLVVIIASYNNKKWYTYNLDSVFAQRYHNYRVIYIDDCSPDGTGNLVKRYIQKKRQKARVTLLQNTCRRTKTANMYRAIHSCDDNEIVVVLDGDDWFAHRDVLAYINEIYTDNDIWMTYGGFQGFPSGKKSNYCREIPQEVIQVRSFRSMRRITAALRSFYAWLYKHIKLEDLFYEGKFMPTTGDVAKMYPMFEMAGRRFKYITEPVYIYNVINPINDFKVHSNLQMKIHWFVVDKPRYELLMQRGLPQKYHFATDVIFVVNDQEKCELQLERLKTCIKGIHHVYVITGNDQVKSHDQGVTILFSEHKTYAESCSLLMKYHQISDFVCMIYEDDIINKDIDLVRSAQLLQQTGAVGFYFDMHQSLFGRTHVSELLTTDIRAWQFGYGPTYDVASLRATLVRRDDLIALLDTSSYQTYMFDRLRVGLFCEEQKIIVRNIV